MDLPVIPEKGIPEIVAVIENEIGLWNVYVVIDEGPDHLTHLCIAGSPKKATPGWQESVFDI